jgi:hypothetical protein
VSVFLDQIIYILVISHLHSLPTRVHIYNITLVIKYIHTYIHTQQQQPVRSMKTLEFGGVSEEVRERTDYPVAQIQDMFKDETFAMLG